MNVSVAQIKQVVADHFGVSVKDLDSPRRTGGIVRPRHAAMYLAKHHTSQSLPEIGRRFGGRDHTTVLYAVQRMQWLIEDDAEFAELMAEMADDLRHLNDRGKKERLNRLAHLLSGIAAEMAETMFHQAIAAHAPATRVVDSAPRCVVQPVPSDVDALVLAAAELTRADRNLDNAVYGRGERAMRDARERAIKNLCTVYKANRLRRVPTPSQAAHE